MPTQTCENMAPPSMGRRIQSRLMLDTVIGTQPELGPAPPDGGYGWIVMFGVTMIQVQKMFFLKIKVLFISSVEESQSILICSISHAYSPNHRTFKIYIMCIKICSKENSVTLFTYYFNSLVKCTA
jgi:hypothetical protein